MRALYFVVVCLGFSPVVQEFVLRDENGRSDAAIRRDVYEREFCILIEDMARTCELTQQQVSKLRVAAKGAVISAIEEWKGVKAEIVKEYDEEERELDSGMGLVVQLQDAGPETATKQPRWSNAVQQTLTKEQLRKYETAEAARIMRSRQAAVAVFIARVDAKLLLSNRQRASLSKLVDRNFGVLMAKDPGSRFVPFYADDSRDSKSPIDHAKLKSLFSDAQMTEWQLSFEDELRAFTDDNVGWSELLSGPKEKKESSKAP